jgi:hypothetical protein
MTVRHIFEISEDDHPPNTPTSLVTHARDNWWTLDFANAFVSPGVNSRGESELSHGASRRRLGDYRPFAVTQRLWSRKVPGKRFSLNMSWNWNTFMGTNTFEHAEFKSENFPHRRPAVFSQTAILSSLISDKFFHCSTTRMDGDTRLHNSKSLIPMNQPPHWTKDRFAWIILSYVILSALDVNNISCLQLWEGTIIAL